MAAAALFSIPPRVELRRTLTPTRPPWLLEAFQKRINASSGRGSCKKLFLTHALQETKDANETAEEITKKYGLELGLWKIFSSGSEGGEDGRKERSKAEQAKELLTKYGGAYLATSITLSLISFSLCYFLVSAGIDVQALLSKVGITTDETGEKVGTLALAYAAHKAASPIRFPPTVALTPIVASWIGKNATKEK